MLTKEQKAKLRAEYALVWSHSERMTDFCTNKVAALAELPGGDFLPIEKQSIEKHFCFGESGYDYDDAQKAAAHARTSESYFKQENMRKFNDELRDIESQYELHGERPGLPDFVMLISEHPYITSPDGSKLRDLHWERATRLIELLGGEIHTQGFPGSTVEMYGRKYRVPTAAELDAIKAATEAARAEHEKKVDRYLKRYGLSQVRSWTYWADA